MTIHTILSSNNYVIIVMIVVIVIKVLIIIEIIKKHQHPKIPTLQHQPFPMQLFYHLKVIFAQKID